jgi:hypothetical protein
MHKEVCLLLPAVMCDISLLVHLISVLFVLVLSGTSAWSVPDNFQKTASSIGNQRGGSLRNTNVGESQFDRQRLPSDASFYSCASGL